MKIIVKFKRGERRITRSGHWVDREEDVRQRVRYAQDPNETDGVTGFRIYGATR